MGTQVGNKVLAVSALREEVGSPLPPFLYITQTDGHLSLLPPPKQCKAMVPPDRRLRVVAGIPKRAVISLHTLGPGMTLEVPVDQQTLAEAPVADMSTVSL